MSNYFDDKASQYGNDANHIASNGGTGSIAYWDAKANQANAQAIADSMRNENYGFGNSDTTSSGNSFGPATTSPVYYGGGSRSGGGLNLAQLFVLGLCCAAAWWGYSTVMGRFSPNMPFERYPIFYPGYNTARTPDSSIKLFREVAIRTAKERFGGLFRADAPYEKFFDGCAPAFKCTEHSYNGFRNLQPYAVNPATYWSDVCRVSHASLHGVDNLPVPPQWTLRAAQKKDGLSTTHVCELTNSAELSAAARGRQTMVTGAASGVAGLMVGCGLLLSRRLRSVRG
ncbi:hypothetical protein [Zoogloea sp.]|uniref:hypothetical protein n=1 Tax=Zoogloea sp. TaxID=49181 RepID=UPI001415DB5A|nr:MAG: hypothetical protein F9K15_18560 [Zoogloea sp.]